MVITRKEHILVLSDREIAREGLKRLLRDYDFDAECASFADSPFQAGFPSAVQSNWQDDHDHLVIVDVMSGAALIELCGSLRANFSKTRLVAIGDERDIELIQAAFKAGIDGFCPRLVTFSRLVLMLSLILLGEKIVPTSFLETILHRKTGEGVMNLQRVQLESSLSDRETGILQCLVNGDANKLIARKLGIAEATVKVHVKAILRKLQVYNRTQAAVWVINRLAAGTGDVGDAGSGSISSEAISRALRHTDRMQT